MPSNQQQALMLCGCCGGCCSGRCEPLTVNELFEEVPATCSDPLPVSLTIEITGTPTWGAFTCFTGTGTLTYKTPVTGGTFCWEGTVTGSCVDCNGATFNWGMKAVLCCNSLNNGFTVTYYPVATICPAVGLVSNSTASLCKPFLISGCWPTFGACWVSCFDDMFMPKDPPSFTVCYIIYETPA